MAIHQEQIQEIQGFEKKIEASAMGMILDNLQMYQYQYPQKSTVRELVSNALDAVKEKYIALSILSGESKVEEHFITRNEDMFKDSNFKPEYYDAKWLKATSVGLYDTSKVYVTYVDGGDRDKDKLLIEDFGVGLGAERLEGYFNLGYSTKRNTKTALGKFGIGAKAALSTSPFYMMTTRYNGREYRFQIYSHKILSIVPALNMDTGKPNGSHIFKNGAVVHYLTTEVPNGTIIEVEAKKHHKQSYIDAVKSQLLYFDNISFRVRNSSGGLDEVPVKADILYEDDHIVMSDNNQYSKPHLLINKVNYGYVDFRELELEDVSGNIGIKVAAEDVTVNPSRESVIWNEQTRETVIARFNTVVGIAETMIAKQLQVDDFLDWVRACCEIAAKYAHSNSIIGRLARIVDLSRAKIPYNLCPELKFDSYLFGGIECRVVSLATERKGSTVKYKIDREAASFHDFTKGLPIIIRTTRSSFRKDKYLLQKIYPQGFIAIRLHYAETGEEGYEEQDTIETTNFIINEADRLGMPVSDLKERIKLVSGYISQSQHAIPYESIIVPDNFNDNEEEEEEQKSMTDEEVLSRAERRKLNGTFPIATLRVAYAGYHKKLSDNGLRIYEWQKLELPVADIDNWDDEEVFYATDKVIDTVDGKPVLESELLHFAGMITRPSDDSLHDTISFDDDSPEDGYGAHQLSRLTHFFNPDKKLKLIKIAQERRKYFMDFKPIQQFFMDIKNKTLTMSNALIRWNTARIMHKQMPKLAFLENFAVFHPKYAGWYESIKKYVETNYRDIRNYSADDNYYGLRNSSVNDLVNHCDKVMKLQLLARQYADSPELIAEAVKDLFNPDQEITDGCAIDIAFYDKMLELLEYSAPISVLLNEMNVLTDDDRPSIPEKVEHEIRIYLGFKNVVTEC